MQVRRLRLRGEIMYQGENVGMIRGRKREKKSKKGQQSRKESLSCEKR